MAGTTVMVQRYEYANLWHTMTDWFNLFWTMEHLGGNVERIVFLDGHAKGALDEVWHTVFARRFTLSNNFHNKRCASSTSFCSQKLRSVG